MTVAVSEEMEDRMIEWVKLGFFGGIAHEFKTTQVDTNTACKLLTTIGVYNGFKPSVVVKLLLKWKGRVAGYQIAREGSPCLYIHLPCWTGQREQADDINSEKIDKETQQMLRDAIIKDFQSLGSATPDELNTLDYSDNIIRVWWD